MRILSRFSVAYSQLLPGRCSTFQCQCAVLYTAPNNKICPFKSEVQSQFAAFTTDAITHIGTTKVEPGLRNLGCSFIKCTFHFIWTLVLWYTFACLDLLLGKVNNSIYLSLDFMLILCNPIFHGKSKVRSQTFTIVPGKLVLTQNSVF